MSDVSIEPLSNNFLFLFILGVYTVPGVHVLFEVCTVLFFKEKFELGKYVHPPHVFIYKYDLIPDGLLTTGYATS